MNFLSVIIILLIVAFAGYQIYKLVLDIKAKRAEASKKTDKNEPKSDKNDSKGV